MMSDSQPNHREFHFTRDALNAEFDRSVRPQMLGVLSDREAADRDEIQGLTVGAFLVGAQFALVEVVAQLVEGGLDVQLDANPAGE